MTRWAPLWIIFICVLAWLPRPVSAEDDHGKRHGIYAQKAAGDRADGRSSSSNASARSFFGGGKSFSFGSSRGEETSSRPSDKNASLSSNRAWGERSSDSWGSRSSFSSGSGARASFQPRDERPAMSPPPWRPAPPSRPEAASPRAPAFSASKSLENESRSFPVTRTPPADLRAKLPTWNATTGRGASPTPSLPADSAASKSERALLFLSPSLSLGRSDLGEQRKPSLPSIASPRPDTHPSLGQKSEESPRRPSRDNAEGERKAPGDESRSTPPSHIEQPRERSVRPDNPGRLGDEKERPTPPSRGEQPREGSGRPDSQGRPGDAKERPAPPATGDRPGTGRGPTERSRANDPRVSWPSPSGHYGPDQTDWKNKFGYAAPPSAWELKYGGRAPFAGRDKERGWSQDFKHPKEHWPHCDGREDWERACERERYWLAFPHWRPPCSRWRYEPPYPYCYHRSAFWDFRLYLGLGLAYALLHEPRDPRFHCSSQLSQRLLYGAEIWAADGVFLGVVAFPEDSPESIADPYGPYGDRYSPRSIWNHHCPYGAYYSSLSAWDPDTWTPPRLYKDGVFVAYLTVNPDLWPRVGPLWLARWLRPYDWDCLD